MNDRLQEVWRLHALGHWIVPCHGRKNLSDKSTPLLSGYLEERLSEARLGAIAKMHPDAIDFAVIPRDMIVVDLECRDGKDGLQDLKDLAYANGTTFNAITTGAYCTKTKSNGYHFWFAVPDGMAFNGSKYLNERRSIEVKRGVCVHVPPSFGYTQEVPIGLGKDAPTLPRCIADLVLAHASDHKPAEYSGEVIRLGERRSKLLSLAGKMHETMALGEAEIYATLIATRNTRCEDPDSFSDEEVASIARDISRKPIVSHEGLLAAGDPVAKSVEMLVGKILARNKTEEESEPIVVLEDHEAAELDETDTVEVDQDDVDPPPRFIDSVDSIRGVRTYQLAKNVHRPNKIMRLWHEWAEVCSPRYQPVLSTYSALSTFGTLMGRKWTSTSGLRPIIYSLCLVGSGGGKSAAMNQAKALFEAIGKPEYMGMAKIGSDSGMINEIRQAGEIMWCWDEFHAILKDWKSNNCPSYKDNIKTMFLEWFSGDDWAGKSLKDLNETPKLTKPHPNLIAMCQPSSFMANLGEKGELLKQGLLPRFLFTYNPQYIDPLSTLDLRSASKSIPPELVSEIKTRLAKSAQSLIQKAQSLSSTMPEAEEDVGAIREYEREIRKLEKSYHAGVNQDGHRYTITTRSWEKMIRLAMVHAFTADEWTGCITLKGLQWAKRIVVDHSDKLLGDILGQEGGDDALETAMEKIKRALRKHGDVGETAGRLRSAIRMKEPIFNDAMALLTADDTVVKVQSKSGKAAYRINK